MARDHALMLTLSAIILLNILAIVLLNNRIAEQESSRQSLQMSNAPNANVPQDGTNQLDSSNSGYDGNNNGNNINLPASPPSAPTRSAVLNQPLVRTLLLTSAKCEDCFDINEYIVELNDTINMAVETASPELFGAEKLPAIAFNQSFEQYPVLLQGWEQVGYTITITNGDYAGRWYVLPTINPPYYTAKDNRVHGLVSVTYLTKKNCAECYDVMINKQFLEASRIRPYKEKIVDADSAEGKKLVSTYNIHAVPTIILDKEANEYRNLDPGWQLVGTKEEDGSLVLRDLERMEVTYYDLSLNKLMRP